MTVFYPDLSNWNAGYLIPTGTRVVVAKATEGDYYMDRSYHDFEQQAKALGAAFSGYHFLKQEISPEKQAKYYYDFAGKTPCMIDCETSGESKPGVDWCQRFKTALEGLGGRVWSVYYPRWYLAETGGSLASLGLPVIASEYRSYDENRWPGSYGGVTPIIWQYTSTPIDMNAFKGTAEELSALINGDNMDPNTKLTFPPQITGWYPDIAKDGGVWTGEQSLNDLLTWMAGRVGHIVHVVEGLQKTVSQLQAGGGASPQAVAQETLAELKAKL